MVCYSILVWFHELFTSYDMEVETHLHVQIENQLGINELQIAC